MQKIKQGFILLLTGLSGAGKTTLGAALLEDLKSKHSLNIDMIDGDVVRDFFEKESGYSHDERFFVTKQIAFGAHLLARNGVNVIVANIAGQYRTRNFLREKWDNFIEVYLDVDVEVCKNNDVKGVYQKALQLKDPQLYGIDLEYEKPRNPDVVVQPYQETVEQSKQKVLDFLIKQGLVS